MQWLGAWGRTERPPEDEAGTRCEQGLFFSPLWHSVQISGDGKHRGTGETEKLTMAESASQPPNAPLPANIPAFLLRPLLGPAQEAVSGPAGAHCRKEVGRTRTPRAGMGAHSWRNLLSTWEQGGPDPEDSDSE